MNPRELPITGYLDRLSGRPGDTLSARVSVREPAPCRARLVRVIGGDPNPAGPGLRLEDLSDVFATGFAGCHQPIRLGSHADIPALPPRDPAAPCTWTALIWPGVLGDDACCIMSEAGFTLEVSAAGVTARVGGVEVTTGVALQSRRWYRIWASVDPVRGRLRVGQMPLTPGHGDPGTREVQGAAAIPTGDEMMIAADPSGKNFTGKIEDPALLPAYVERWSDPLVLPAAPLTLWDFSVGIDTQSVTDTGPHGCHGTLFNVPARAMAGARWSGQEMCWRHAPRDYAAIHFHDDDLGDCGWAESLSFPLPEGLASGVYALHIACDAGEDFLPLYVLPPRGTRKNTILFLAPTFTYQAYANHARGNADAAYRARVTAWGADPYNPDDFPIYGRSTYNRHADGSGIAYSSRLRPVLTMRPGFLTFNDANGSGLRHFPADTHILGWLAAHDLPFDVTTDEDLDDEGVSLLRGYRTVLTGSHPEYHTAGTLDGLRDYLAEGGNLCYLGGNGFYWRIARHPDVPGVIELRRTEGGIRAWAAEGGEYFHAFDGQYGGLWRRSRRAPQQLVGVGFSAQGLFEGVGYERLPASYEQGFAWMFEGVGGPVFGAYGLSGGGAAGFELDRVDPMLGSPDNVVILARSLPVPPSFFNVPEDILSRTRSETGENPPELLRGEIVYFTTPSGGAVFSTGSITFCGSLWQDGFRGPVSRLLENVVRRFARVAPASSPQDNAPAPVATDGTQ